MEINSEKYHKKHKKLVGHVMKVWSKHVMEKEGKTKQKQEEQEW